MIGKCQDCGKFHDESDVLPFERTGYITDRVLPGEEMPMGICDRCGALVNILSYEAIVALVLDNPDRCPYCGYSVGGDGQEITFSGGSVLNGSKCFRCGAGWRSEYIINQVFVDDCDEPDVEFLNNPECKEFFK